MKAHGNGTPETCASNLLRIVRGEVPFDRVRGRDPSLVDRVNVSDDVTSDAEWLIGTYEPRAEIESIETKPVALATGDFATLVKITRKDTE